MNDENRKWAEKRGLFTPGDIQIEIAKRLTSLDMGQSVGLALLGGLLGTVIAIVLKMGGG